MNIDGNTFWIGFAAALGACVAITMYLGIAATSYTLFGFVFGRVWIRYEAKKDGDEAVENFVKFVKEHGPIDPDESVGTGAPELSKLITDALATGKIQWVDGDNGKRVLR